MGLHLVIQVLLGVVVLFGIRVGTRLQIFPEKLRLLIAFLLSFEGSKMGYCSTVVVILLL